MEKFKGKHLFVVWEFPKVSPQMVFFYPFHHTNLQISSHRSHFSMETNMLLKRFFIIFAETENQDN